MTVLVLLKRNSKIQSFSTDVLLEIFFDTWHTLSIYDYFNFLFLVDLPIDVIYIQYSARGSVTLSLFSNYPAFLPPFNIITILENNFLIEKSYDVLIVWCRKNIK